MIKPKFKIGQKAYRLIPVEIKAVDKENKTLEAVFSTQDVDRHGDTVVQKGWDLQEYKANPVILNSHNHSDATEVIGQASNVRIEGKKLLGTIKFAVEENPKAKIIFDLYAGKYLRAFSVGFVPLKFKENKDGSKDWFVIEESRLLEVSAVSVPANARALAKKKGIDVEMLEEKNEGDDEYDKQDEDAGNETGDDQLPKNPQVPETDGDEPAEDGDSGKSGEPEADEDAGEDPGAGESGEPSEDEGAEAVEPKALEDADNGDKRFELSADKETKYKELDYIEATFGRIDGIQAGIAIVKAETPPDPAPAPAVKKQSRKILVARAISKIADQKQRQISRAKMIIEDLLGENGVPVERDTDTREQVRKRKLNQAIRALYSAK